MWGASPNPVANRSTARMAAEERVSLLSPIDGDSAIRVRGLTHSFGSVKVMNQLSMTVARGASLLSVTRVHYHSFLPGSIFGTFTNWESWEFIVSAW